MASSNGEEEDLIDLDDGTFVTPIIVSVMPFDGTSEDQEHLLDVCPPKLEQKLSFTREDKLIRQHCNNGHVLVTLGHDQVVPKRKRIDVVSLETIKRVRDITKNLEPVMKACERQSVHGETTGDYEGSNCEDVMSAFDFLSEIDDNEDYTVEKLNNGTSQEIHDTVVCEKPLVVSYPLEPTCFIDNSSVTYDEIDKGNGQHEWDENTPVVNQEAYQYVQVSDHLENNQVLTDQMKRQTEYRGDEKQCGHDDGGSERNYSSDGMESPINTDIDCGQPSTSNGIKGFGRTIR